MDDQPNFNLSNRSSEDIVEAAIQNPIVFKVAAKQLTQRPPSRETAERLIQAYEEGQAPAWMTAHLLGCIGHECGYDTVRQILLDAPGQLAESYAGPALVRMLGKSAFEDLCHLLSTAPHIRSREGAAYGLCELGAPALEPVLSAALAGSIRRDSAGSKLARLRVDAATLADLLASEEERLVKLGLEIVYFLILDSGVESRSCVREARPTICDPLRSALARENLRMMPRKRRTLQSWLDSPA